MNEKPVVGIVMGSKSDLECVQNTFDQLDEFGIPMKRLY